MMAFFVAASCLLATDPGVWTLTDVLADARERAPAVLQARARASAEQRRVALASPWPDPFVAVGPDEVTTQMPPVVRYQLTQTVPLPMKAAPRRDVAQARSDAVDHVVHGEQRRAQLLALQLFLRAVWIDKALAANAGEQALVVELGNSARARIETGSPSAHHDALIAHAERATLQRDALALARERAVVIARLQELRGQQPHDDAQRLLDDNADAHAADAPERIDDALAAQPELASAADLVRVAQARARVAGSVVLPDVVVQAMAMQSFMPGVPSNVGAMVGVSVPLFSGMRVSDEQSALHDEEQAAAAAHHALELRLRAEWDEAHGALRSALDTLALYDDSIVPATRDALDSTTAQYAAQRAPLVEVLSLLRAQTSILLEREAASLDVRLARARLRWFLASPPIASLAPRAPTLFAPSMASGSPMGTSPSTMQDAPATGLSRGMGGDATPPSSTSSGMGGM